MSFEQIPLFEESRKPGGKILIETAQEKALREAAEAKAAFAKIHEVIENAPAYDKLKRSTDAEDGRNRYTRKLSGATDGDTEMRSWIKDHEDRQDARDE